MKKLTSLILTLLIIATSVAIFGTAQVSAASYPAIPALKIARIYQPPEDNKLCYWASMATVQGYCLSSYTYGGVTTNYRVPGQDYNYLKNTDAITKYFRATGKGNAHDSNNLTNYYPVKMTLVRDDIGRNASTYQKIYNQLALGKPVIVYTGGHASVVIGYSGSATTLDPKGFTVMEIKKDKAGTVSGYWWENSATYFNKHANSPQIDTNTLKTNGGKYLSCYVNLDSWISYCGGKLTEICYPTGAVNTSYTFAFSANGGTGSMSSIKTDMGKTVTFPPCTFTYDGYVCAGYYAQRKSDSKWHAAGVGWRTLQEIIDQNLQRSVYEEGLTFTMNDSWTRSGGIAGDTFTLVPVWKPLSTKLFFYGNHSDSNYMMTINPSTYSQYYQSRNSSVYTLSTESVNGSTALKITGKTAGAVGSDLVFKTQTNQSPNVLGCTGDNKAMQLTFRAKSSVDGTKMYFRWGYTSDVTSVTLSTEWKEYTIDMNKQPYDGSHMHPYFDKAGTFYVSDVVLRDASASAPAQAETSDLLYTHEYAVGKPYGTLPTIQRSGYTFMGWYTSKTGGAKITKDTLVLDCHTAVYARWSKTSVDSGKVTFGDTDLSGVITVKDATLVQKYLAGISTLTGKQIFAGNVINKDALNIKDATAIQKWCARLDSGSTIINSTTTYTGG